MPACLPGQGGWGRGRRWRSREGTQAASGGGMMIVPEFEMQVEEAQLGKGEKWRAD